MLRSLRHYPRAKNQRHHSTDRLEERDMKRGSARRSSLKERERSIVKKTNVETFKGNVGETFERQGGAHMGFSEHSDTILGLTELN